MPPRNPELPEGTDHIINGAMERGAGTSASTGSSGGFVGSGQADDTGGTTGTKRDKAVAQIKERSAALRDQASGKAREYAVDGKTRAADALGEFSRAVSESAQSIDERLGAEYGDYARRAADAVSGFADTLRSKDVDELIDDARAIVRKSPVIAIGTAAAVGFALARLIKSGMAEGQSGETTTPPAIGQSPTGTTSTGTTSTTTAGDTTTTDGAGI
ncbi:hypothetical protein [Sphingosinicella humi]|uniref:Nutrient deprivation-induced protein n=1 Tax=Allosphingosinicella humi TaxID=2068657 RepID=A0A2U2IYY8_9SPHN|nr:hypothetical protein [Sphingosinicella humi]PWG01251.1 hypothetical protein DF286_14065 [Sphingosinicella humi]